MNRPIQIVEVAPRDGLQNETAVLTPSERADFVRRLEAAGARRIEAASFVNPRIVPQMAGAEAVMDDLPRQEGRSRIGLALNARGYDRALASGVNEINLAMAVTDGFGLRNQGMAVEDCAMSKLITCAPRRRAANSKLVRVRVDGSKKRLTIVRSASSGASQRSFRNCSRNCTALSSRRVNTTRSIPSRVIR